MVPASALHSRGSRNVRVKGETEENLALSSESVGSRDATVGTVGSGTILRGGDGQPELSPRFCPERPVPSQRLMCGDNGIQQHFRRIFRLADQLDRIWQPAAATSRLHSNQPRRSELPSPRPLPGKFCVASDL